MNSRRLIGFPRPRATRYHITERGLCCASQQNCAADVAYGSWLRENSEIEFANGNFVSTSINLKNKSAGDGCRDKTIEKTILRAFRARTKSAQNGFLYFLIPTTVASAFVFQIDR